MHGLVGATRARWGTLLLVVVGAIACAIGGMAVAGAASGREPVQRTLYGTAEPGNAPGQSLTLQRIVIAPGAKLATHFHEGTQLATIRAGVLTYHVVSGTVLVTRAGETSGREVGPGVVSLRKGDTIVENEALVHFGANRGKKPVAIELAALLHDGAPLSTPVGEGGAGTTALHVTATLMSPTRTLHQAGPDNRFTYGWNRLDGTATVDGQPVGVELLGSVDYTTGSGPFSGFVTFTFGDGSTLGVSMQGAATANAADGSTAFTATLGVIGGTGRYLDTTTGSGTFTGSRTTALGGNVSATFDLQLGT
jgi:hypothetical protein